MCRTSTRAAALLLALSSTSLLTADEPPTHPTGQLGQRYIEVNVNRANTEIDGVGDIDNSGIGVGISLPVVRDLFDIRLSYAFAGYEDSSIEAHQGKALVLFHHDLKGFKPFIGAGLGYTWVNEDMGDSKGWMAGLGVEIPLGRFSLAPMVVYSGSLDSGASGGDWHYELDANVWLTNRIAISAGLAYYKDGDLEVTGANLGLRIRL